MATYSNITHFIDREILFTFNYWQCLTLIIIIIGEFSFPHTASAGATNQSLDDIKLAAHAYLKAHFSDEKRSMDIHIGSLDRRLRLRACPVDVVAFIPPGNKTGRITSVGVRCPAQHSWRVFIPVKIHIYATVIVAKKPLSRGKIVTYDDAIKKSVDINSIRGSYFTDSSKIIGMKLTRAISADMPFTSASLKRQKIIRRGQQIRIIAKTKFLNITMHGKALMDGAEDDIIRALNTKSDRIVEGRVTSMGTIEVKL